MLKSNEKPRIEKSCSQKCVPKSKMSRKASGSLIKSFSPLSRKPRKEQNGLTISFASLNKKPRRERRSFRKRSSTSE